MKQIIFFVLIFVVSSFFALLFAPVTAYAAVPDECRPVGGVCRVGSCPSLYTIDYSLDCPQISQRCCVPPASCSARGGSCTNWIPGGDTCQTARGGAQVLPNTCAYPEICCRFRTCSQMGGACTPWNPNGPTCGSLGEIIGNYCYDEPGAAGPICCRVAGGGSPPPRYNITGVVFLDNNRNGVRDGGEPGDAGTTIVMSGRSSGSRTSNGSGNYAFNSFLAGNYALTIAMPAGYINTTPVRRTTSLGPSRTINFGIVQIYDITGNVFNDVNKNRYKDSTNGVAEVNISGITMSATAPINVNSGAGTFAMNGLFAGTYTVRYTSAMPAGYFLIYPRNGPPPAFSVTVGPSCTVDRTSGATCSDGSVNNLNFAISNSIPWMQSYGLSMRIDNGFDDVIPATPLYPPYASVADKLNNATSTLISQGTLPSSLNNTGPYKVYVNGLTVGAQYRIVVSGTYYYNVTLGSLTDAQWDDWQQGSPNCFCRRINKVVFNNVASDAFDYQSAYNPAHEYTYYWTADSTQLEMYIPDTYWTDNSGSFSYRMYTSFQ